MFIRPCSTEIAWKQFWGNVPIGIKPKIFLKNISWTMSHIWWDTMSKILKKIRSYYSIKVYILHCLSFLMFKLPRDLSFQVKILAPMGIQSKMSAFQRFWIQNGDLKPFTLVGAFHWAADTAVYCKNGFCGYCVYY